MSRAKSFLSFPNPVNEVAARVVAGIVVVLCAAAIGFRQPWLLAVLTYGFWARVLAGPKISPAGLFATRIAAPRLSSQARLVPGPPKRFAQGIGALFSTTSLILWAGFGLHGAAMVLVGVLAAAAFAESALAFCLGCKAFSILMKVGVIPNSICEECSNLASRSLSLAGEG